MNKKAVVPIILGLGIIVVGGVLFWPSKAKAMTPAKPGPQPLPPPGPQPLPAPAPRPAPPVPIPAPVPLPPPIPNVTPAEVFPLIVTGDNVNARSGPSTSYAVLAVLKKGTGLQLPHADSWAPPTAGAPQGWSGVTLPDGRSAWVASQFLTIPAT